MTQEEKNFIKSGLQSLKKNKTTIILIVVLYLILTFIMSVGIYFICSLKIAIITFIAFNLLFVCATVPTRYKLVKLISKDEIWVREAIFLSINKYHYASFEINDNRIRKIMCANAIPHEEICRGNKVIIIKVRGLTRFCLARD
jgi:hypothetical protein